MQNTLVPIMGRPWEKRKLFNSVKVPSATMKGRFAIQTNEKKSIIRKGQHN
jgi:hypothetical protein